MFEGKMSAYVKSIKGPRKIKKPTILGEGRKRSISDKDK